MAKRTGLLVAGAALAAAYGDYRPSNLELGVRQTAGDFATCTGSDVVRDCLDLNCGGEATELSQACQRFDDESTYAAVPHAFLIGCQKCGSTSLHASLLRHPSIVGACGANSADTELAGATVTHAQPGAHDLDRNIVVNGPAGFPKEPGIPGKELHFLDWESRWERGRAFYFCHYPRLEHGIDAEAAAAVRHVVALDSTPDYLRDPDVPARLATLLRSYRNGKGTKQGKFLVILRNPVDRWISWFKMAFEAGWLDNAWQLADLPDNLRWDARSAASELALRELETFRACETRHGPKLRGVARSGPAYYPDLKRLCANSTEDDRALGPSLLGGLYSSQLRNWFRTFDPEQFLVLPLGVLSTHPSDAADAATSFLDLPPLPRSVARMHVDANEATDREASLKTKAAAAADALLNETALGALNAFYEPYMVDLAALVGSARVVAPFPLEL